ncbi:MAG TPA: acyltransferase family protein [Marmoricola sp.]|nr:acyltransferase family protein [Marmoricola sp.]
MTSTLDRPRHAHSASSERPRRDPWFDNAKMLLVTLVVVGHTWPYLPDTTFNDRLYDWMYLWHMPAFVVVTGYLSRRFTYSRRNLRRLVTTVLLPYLVFEGLLALFRTHVGGERFDTLWIDPHWPMWFLAALVAWRLATPALQRLPYALPLAFALSLAGGVVGTTILDVNRILGFLPFFALGLLAEERHLDAVRSTAGRVVGVAVLAAGVLVAFWVDHDLGSEWLYYRTAYADLDTSWWQGMGIRAALLTVSVAMALAVLAWIPRSNRWFTRMGSASLVVYLFHGFFIKGASYAGFADWAAGRPVLSLVVATLGGVGIALLLAWRPIRKPLEKIITPSP